MKCNISKLSKILMTITLSLIVVGMAILGVFGINKSIDYKQSYEVSVNVFAPNVENIGDKVQQNSSDYFASKNLEFSLFSTQSIDNGSTYIYKFNTNPNVSVNDMETYIEGKIESSIATVSVNEMVAYANVDVLYTALSIGIIVIFALIYLFFMERGAGALASAIVAVISVVLYVALVAICRISVHPYFGVGLGFATLFSFIISSVMVNRCKEEFKNQTGSSKNLYEIAIVAQSKSLIRVLFISIVLVLALIVFGAIGFGNVSNIALNLIISTISSALSAFTWTPVLWASLKKNKN